MGHGDEAGHEAAVRARAYQLWVESGYADGYQEQHWRQAEREIAARGVEVAPATDDRAKPRDTRHSDGMSAHPSVLDPGPRQLRR